MTDTDKQATTIALATTSSAERMATDTVRVRETQRVAVARPSRKRGVAGIRRRNGFLLTIPALLMLAGSVVYPILWALNLSAHTFDAVNPGKSDEFVGLANYAEIVGSPDFRLALLNTFAFVIVTLSLE